MFCYECGFRVEATDRFCPQCGILLASDSPCMESVVDMCTSGNKYFNIGLPPPENKNNERGYIFTNTRLLSRQFNVHRDIIIEILREFADIRSREGIDYKIIDSAQYTDDKKQLDDWHFHHKILSAHYNDDINITPPDFLFIIGGSDIIPMPSLPISLPHSKEIDSDLLYGYFYGDSTEKMILNLSIFRKEIMLFCGRLPLACDTTVQEFIKMLSDILIAGNQGLLNVNLHVQCDPNWKKVTTLAASKFLKHMPNRNINNDCFFGPLMLTPQLYPGTADFDRSFPYHQASIFYYNLHGTNTPGVDCFGGNTLGKKKYQPALYPSNMAAVEHPNMVVTEACYGGWFKIAENRHTSKKKNETVLLAAMHGGTVCYVGASCVAYGMVDTAGHPNIAFADVLAQAYLSALYEGLPAGVALYMAKQAVFNADQQGESHTTLITITEFNLFGDPALQAITIPGAYGMKSCKSALSDVSSLAYNEHKVEYDSNSPSGILGYVRSLVDKNLQDINSTMTKHLYNKFGITPRRLNMMVSNKWDDGQCRYTCFYEADNEEWVVEMDGRSKEIFYSVCSK